MNELHDLLERLSETGEPRDPAALFGAAQSRATSIRRRRRNVRVVGAATAAICIAVVAVALVSRSSGSNPHVTTRPTGPRITAGPPLETIPLPASPAPPLVAAANGRLWIAQQGTGAVHGRLLEIDPATGRVEHSTELAGDSPYAIAADAKAVWVRSQQLEEYTKLEKIDAETHRVVATIPFTISGGLAVTPESVWAIDGETLVKIDPQTAQVEARIPLPGAPYGPLFVSAGPHGVLLANSYNGTLLSIDGRTARTIATLPAGRMVQLDDAVWVASGSTLAPVLADGSFGSPPLDVGAPITALAGTGHTLWVATQQGLVHVDTQNDQIENVDLPAGVHRADDVAIDTAGNDVWTVVDNPTRLLRLDADAPFSSGEIVAEPQHQPDLAVAVPTGCPTKPPTPAPGGKNTEAAVRAAAIDYVRRDRFWARATIDAVYRVDQPAGTVGEIFAANVSQCGATIAEQTYGVEMQNPLITQSNSRIAQVVVSHFADGWHVWGYYH
jgi:DNA-binding beta-propeller fold protein YncE